jgi:hypothetical protein
MGAYVVDNYTKLLCHFDVAKATSTTCETGQTMTFNNTADCVVTQKRFGAMSAVFDGGATTWISVPDHADWDFGTGDFTIDAWLYPTQWNTYNTIVCATNTGASIEGYLLTVAEDNVSMSNTSGGQTWDRNETMTATGNGVVSLNQWNHIAAVKASGVLYMFANGVLNSYGNNAHEFNASRMLIGDFINDQNGNGVVVYGYIDELRISKGIARWTSNFIPSRAKNIQQAIMI